MRAWWLVVAVALGVLGDPVAAEAGACPQAGKSCLASVRHAARACREACNEVTDVRGCRGTCRENRSRGRAVCGTVADPCAFACADPGDALECRMAGRSCRREARAEDRVCRRRCRFDDHPLCRAHCARSRGASEAACGYGVVSTIDGAAELPDLPTGQPADLSLIDAAERAVVEAADARAETIRTRPLRLLTGAPGAQVTVTQIKHGFDFGIATDLLKLQDPNDRAFFTEIATRYIRTAVIENTFKWRRTEPEQGVYDFAAAEEIVEWARSLGLAVKGHTLMWGNGPPLSSSGVPPWLIELFPDPDLSESEKGELRELMRTWVTESVARFRGRILSYDATNETLQPFTQWYIDRLGPEIAEDVFRWAHAADPDAPLIFNEWINEVFTGLPGPFATTVRDRVLELLGRGVPIEALGQQGHFAPGIAFVGIPVDLSQRTRIDDYQVALDTLAETGLPIHITETNFIAPDDPEARAAQGEALMRVWWGHPSVEQIVFWGAWNKIAGRDEFDVGFWDDDRNITRHGAAILALLNDRWRTRSIETADADGLVELRATIGDYAADWEVDGQPVHARFRVGHESSVAAVIVAP